MVNWSLTYWHDQLSIWTSAYVWMHQQMITIHLEVSPKPYKVVMKNGGGCVVPRGRYIHISSNVKNTVVACHVSGAPTTDKIIGRNISYCVGPRASYRYVGGGLLEKFWHHTPWSGFTNTIQGLNRGFTEIWKKPFLKNKKIKTI